MPLLSPASSRYVLLILDDEAETITTRLGRTAMAAEIVRCSSDEAAWTALTSGRRYSAVLAEGVDPGVREAAERAAIPVLSVGRGLAAAELATGIAAVATPVPMADRPPDLGPAAARPCLSGGRRPEGRLVAVCGPGGTGASSVAAALALAWGSGAAADSPRRTRVLLADLALRADQAFLSRMGERTVGLLPLVDVARYRPVSVIDVRRHTVSLVGCRLLPGLRRPSHWTAVSPTGFDTVLSGLLGIFDRVVADITGDFEGETETGSFDVEDRNHMARHTATAADVVVAVGGPGANGSRRLTLLVDELLDRGVDPGRIQPVINQIEPDVARREAFWSSRQPISFTPTPNLPRICGLPSAAIGLPRLADACGRRLPPGIARPLLTAVTGLLSRLPPADRAPRLVPVPVQPGSLGCAAP